MSAAAVNKQVKPALSMHPHIPQETAHTGSQRYPQTLQLTDQTVSQHIPSHANGQTENRISLPDFYFFLFHLFILFCFCLFICCCCKF